MSICVYGRIKRKCIKENLFERFLVEFFSPKSDIVRRMDEKSVTYEGVSSENTVSISLVLEKKPPHNVYDSNIVNTEFRYVQLIIFEIKKEEATIDNYKKIIMFFIFLNNKIDSDILVTSDVHDEICLLKKTEIIWSKNLSYDYGEMIQ